VWCQAIKDHHITGTGLHHLDLAEIYLLSFLPAHVAQFAGAGEQSVMVAGEKLNSTIISIGVVDRNYDVY